MSPDFGSPWVDVNLLHCCFAGLPELWRAQLRFAISLLGLAVKFNLFGSFEGFVYIPFDRIGDMLLAIGRDFERLSNRTGA